MDTRRLTRKIVRALEEDKPRLRDRSAPWLGVLAFGLFALAVGTLVLRYGTDLLPLRSYHGLDWAVLLLNLGLLAAHGALAPDRVAYLRQHRVVLGLAVAAPLAELLAGLVAVADLPARLLLAGVKLSVAYHGLRWTAGYALGGRRNPYLTLAGSFVLIILIGTGLLMLPKAVPAGASLSFVDAFFTATSATCVTGLVVVDTGTAFSRSGQWVILALIQIGGLGLMTMVAFATAAMGRGLSLGERAGLKEVFSLDDPRVVARTLGFILAMTLVFETAGTVLLWFLAPAEGLPASERLFSALFHSVSAFCNAGFALRADSMMAWHGTPAALAVVIGLIVAGGLGFLVHGDLWDRLRARWSRRELSPEDVRLVRLRAHTVLVLWMTAGLLVVGTVGVWLMEHERGALTGLSPAGGWFHALFASVTARTAGFNTVDTAAFTDGGLYLLMLLMFIGASPGSTGGGVKTSTVALAGLAIWGMLINREGVEVAHRRVPGRAVEYAMTVLILGAVLVGGSALFLMATQVAGFRDLLFETVSAFGTVGLSTGATPGLTAGGKVFVSLLMLVGRIGPLTLVMAMAGRVRRPPYEYPSEGVMVG